jgi:adenylate cyclase
VKAGRQGLRTALLVAVAAVATVTGIAVDATNALRRIELATVDARFSIRNDNTKPRTVAVVAIDGPTLTRLDVRFPFRRSLHARAIRALTRAGARVIGYDVQFTEPTEPAQDLALIDAVTAAHRIVLGTTEVDDGGQTHVLGGGDVLRESGASVGSANYIPDSDGVIRRLRRSIDGLDTFAVVAAKLAGAKVSADEIPADGLPIDFKGRVVTVPFWRLLEGRVPANLLRGRVVVIGATAPSLQDVHATSAAASERMPGAEIQANAIATLLANAPLRNGSGFIDTLLVVLGGALVPFAALRLIGLRVLIPAFVAGAGLLVGSQIAFNADRIVELTPALAALVLATGSTLAVDASTALRDRRRMRSVSSRFVPSQVVDEVLERTGDDLRLGGVRLEGTVLFADLRGFTGLAETIDAERVIDVLNRYLTEMSDAILDHGGTLVSYMGDGIMAVFGAPIEQTDHADRALAAAREMLGPRRERFNAWIRSEGLHDEGFHMGVGLCSGPVMSGNVGSERRLEYTAVGDTTNTAARLEGMTKGTPHQLFLADATRQALTRTTDGLAEVGELPVRGRQATLKVWTAPETDVALKDAVPAAGAAAVAPALELLDDEAGPV